MNKQEYKLYEESIERFNKAEKLKMLSMKKDKNGECEEGFSWYWCDMCSRNLGGNRTVHLGLTKNDDIIEYSLCDDCLYYNEYGQLDDMTMEMTFIDTHGYGRGKKMITTNNIPRELLCFAELTPEQQLQVDSDSVVDGQEYFVYRGLTYCMDEFLRLDDDSIWDGGLQETNVSGIVIRYTKNDRNYPLGDWVIVGRSYM